MRHRSMITVLASALLLLPSAQAGAQQHGGAGHTGAEEDERALLTEGVRVWARQCIRCHQVRVVRERTDRDWATIVAHMRVRANLTRRKAAAVLTFLQSMNEPAGHHEEEAETHREPPECPPPSSERVEAGVEVYRGAGNCIDCHGPGGRGGKDAPPLSGSRWSNLSEIARVVTRGAPGMPPMGDELTDAQICAVSAYVHSISR